MAACLERLKQYLGESGVHYGVQHHHEVYTMQEVAAEVGEKGRAVAKVFIASADGNPVMLVLAAPDHVDYDRVRDYLGAENVERAPEELFKQWFPDCEVGAMPPFGNLYKVPVYMDRKLMEAPHITFQAGSHSDTIRIDMHDYMRLASPKVTRFAVTPEPAM
jgi:Ala-tRNA(Pro) deacylase